MMTPRHLQKNSLLITVSILLVILSNYPTNGSSTPQLLHPSDITTSSCSNVSSSTATEIMTRRKQRRFMFRGPVLTLTLKDPFADNIGPTVAEQPISISTGDSKPASAMPFSGSNNGDGSVSETNTILKANRHNFWSLRQNTRNYSNFLNLNSLAPTLFCSILSTTKPLPNYIPSLQSTSISAGYKYDDVRNAPSFVEGEVNFRKTIGAGVVIEADINPSYQVKGEKAAIVFRVGADSGSIDGGYGCFGLVRFAMTKGKRYLEHIRGSYRMNLPFTAVGSISITPSYDIGMEVPTCNIIGKSASGRTAAVLDLNLSNPTLSFVHALDQRNTISPEISLYDAKIQYNWSVELDSGSIKTRVDPCSAVQVTWTDQSMNGKWVTDFKLPLVGSPGPLAGDIRVRRQFVF
mmetsp:Transcript_18269/g.21126  ORF Transcript_18269/g.21126 Transcript_18269/m.21126 type:complete len:406 (-) Transcript_18269:157-1374(-)